jgi:hypothetical protein
VRLTPYILYHPLFVSDGYSHMRHFRRRLGAEIIHLSHGSSTTSTVGAAAAALQQDVAMVFLQSDSGEGYITVDGDVCDTGR